MEPLTITAEPHALMRPLAFLTRLPGPLGEHATPPEIARLLAAGASAPFERDEAVRTAVRDALRLHGYKPTGRGKPASEYLVRAAEAGALSSINLVVDTCNAVSLHSGFPITVVDAELARPPYRIAPAGAGERYVFNLSGQTIDLEGLVCLFDADGPCGNAVKDSQRTKTEPGTRQTLSVVWGCAPHEDRSREAVIWYRALLEGAGALTESVEIPVRGAGTAESD